MKKSYGCLNLSEPRIRAARKLIQLSFRLASAAAWSIPALRLRAETQFGFMLMKGTTNALSYLTERWNFEETLQKRIAGFVDLLITHQELSDIFVFQWKENLAEYMKGTQERQSEFKSKREIPKEFVPSNLNEREQLVKHYMPRGNKLLYVGCGVGRDCFRYEKIGYEVVGIDTETGLLKAMQNWRDLLKMRTRPVKMNGLSLGFMPHTFNAAIVEIYGAFSSKRQRLKLQQELARVLKPDGFALMVAPRFHYAKYIQLQRLSGVHKYVDVLRDELLRPSPKEPTLETDKDTDKLFFGVMRGSYTCDSLALELSACFKVEKCYAAKDKRYLLALIRPLAEGQWTGEEGVKPEIIVPSKDDIKKANAFIRNVEIFVDDLEKNAKMTGYFIARSAILENKCWKMLNELLRPE